MDPDTTKSMPLAVFIICCLASKVEVPYSVVVGRNIQRDVEEGKKDRIKSLTNRVVWKTSTPILGIQLYRADAKGGTCLLVPIL
jgi:hypothetical protein